MEKCGQGRGMSEMVIWLIGISGSGKTTLGLRLKEFFDKRKRPAYVIDGDWVRDFYGNDLGYSRDDRIANVKRIILAAHVLDQNGIITIVCNISPFESLRELCRARIGGYNEVYLKRDVLTCKKNDIKKVYQNSHGKTELVGIDVAFEEPLNSDLVINVNEEDVDRSFARIMDYLKGKYPGEFK